MQHGTTSEVSIIVCDRTADRHPAEEAELLQLLTGSLPGWPDAIHPVQPIDHLRWKLGNGASPSSHVIGTVGSKIVSCVLFGERRVRAQERTLIACQVLDGAVHPAYRGKGILSAMLKALADDPQNGYDVLLDQTGHPAVKKVLKGSNTAVKVKNRIEVLVRPPLQGLVVAPTSPPVASLEIAEVDEFDKRVDVLQAKASQAFDFMVERDREYLNWRFCDARGGRFRIHIAVDEGEMLGYVAFCVAQRIGYLADMLVLPDRIDVADSLISSALQVLDRSAANSIRCAIPVEHPYREPIGRFGFVVRRGRRRMLCAGRGTADLEFPHSSKARLHWMFGDSRLL